MNEPLNWTTQQRAVSALKGCTYNPRRMSAAGKERLLGSLRKFNLVDIPVVNADDTILSGHQRVALLILEERAAELIDVRVPNRALTEEEAKEYMLHANNHAGEWDQGLLATHFTDTLKDTAHGMEQVMHLPSLPDFSEKNVEVDTDTFEDKMTITLTYTMEEHERVRTELAKVAATPEQALWILLGINDEN
jgi:hypothetical protein